MGIPVVSFITLAMMWYGGVDYETFKTFGWETVYFVVLKFSIFSSVYYSAGAIHWFLVSSIAGAGVDRSMMVIALNLFYREKL